MKRENDLDQRFWEWSEAGDSYSKNWDSGLGTRDSFLNTRYEVRGASPKKMIALLTAIIFAWTMICPLGFAETINLEGGAVDVNVQDNVTNWNVTGNPIWNVPEFNVNQGSIYNIAGMGSGSSLALLVNGGSASNIFGTMNLSNLDFILQNIAGINIGSNAMINLNNASLLASTLPLNMSATDFLAHDYQFSGKGGFLSNEGRITGTNADLVALVANAIENRGTIEVPMGTVALAAGNTVTIGISGDGLVSIGVDEATANSMGLSDQIKNSGTVQANGGRVMLSAKAIDGLFDKAINIAVGTNATGVVVADDGVIEFVAQGDVLNNGTLQAERGSIDINATGDVETLGVLKAETLREKAASFAIGGDYHVGQSYHENLDKAITYAASAGVSGIINDVDNIIVNTGVTLTLGAATTFNAGTDGSGSFTMNGTAAITGASTYSLTITAPDTVTLNTITLGGNLTVTGGSLAGSGTITFNGTGAQTVTANGALSNKVVINKPGIGGAFTVASGTTISLGDAPTSQLMSSPGYSGSITNNGTINIASGTWTVAGGAGASSVTLTNNGTINHSGSGWAMNGIVHFSNSATGVVNYSGTSVSVTGNFSQLGTFDLTGKTITFNGNGISQTVTSNGVLGGTVVISKPSHGGTFIVASGTSISLGDSPTSQLVTNPGYTGTITNNGTINVTSGTWTIASSYYNPTITNNGTINHSGSGLVFSPGSGYTMNFTNNAGATVTYSNAAGTWTTTGSITNSGTITYGGASWTVSGSLTNNASGTITYAGTPITIGGNLTQSGTFDLTGKTVTFNGTANYTITAGTSLENATTVINKGSGGSGTIAEGTTINLGNSPTSTLNSGASWASSLTNNGTIIIGTGTWTTNSGGNNGTSVITNNGTVTSAASAWDINFSNFVNNGTITSPVGATINIERSFTQNGVFDLTGKTVTFDGPYSSTITAPGELGGTVVISKSTTLGLTVNVAAGTSINLGDNPTTTMFYGTINNNGTIVVNSGTWTLNNNYNGNGVSSLVNNGIITHNGSDWIFRSTIGNNFNYTNSADATTTFAGTNLTMNGNFTQLGTFDLTGKTITFNSTGTSTLSSSTVTANGALGGTVVINKTTNSGNFTVAAGTSINLGDDPISRIYGSSFSSAANFTNNGTIIINSGTWTLTNAFNNATSACRFVNNGTITHNGSGWIFNSAASNNAFHFTNSADATVTYAGAGITTNGNFIQLGTFDLAGKTLTFNGSVNQTANQTLTASSDLGSVIVNKSAGNFILGSDVTMESFTRTDGIVSNPAGAYTLTVNGDFSMSTTDAFGGANLTLAFGGANAQAITQNAGTISSAVQINKTNTTDTVTAATPLTLGAALTVTQGTLDLGGNNLTVSAGGTTVAANGILDLAGAVTTGITGGFTVNGILRLMGSETNITAPTLGSDSTVAYDGTSVSPYTLKSWTYQNLMIMGGSSSVFRLPADESLKNVTITSGTLDSNGFDMTLSGSWANTGSFTAGSRTVTLSGADQSISGSTAFNILSVPGSYTLVNPLSAADLSIGGTLDVAGNDITATTITNNGTLVLQGGENISGSVTNHDASLVRYNGTNGPYTLKAWAYHDLTLAGNAVYTVAPGATIGGVGAITESARVSRTVSATGHGKTYDATRDATVDLSLDTNLFDTWYAVSVGGYTGALFSDKNVGTGKAVSVTGISLAGDHAALFEANATVSTTADITAKAIMLSGITAENKVYDATTEATVSTADASFNGMIEGDDLTVSSTGAFVDKNAADGKTVNLTNTLGGEDLDNYQITDQGTTTADITAKAITLSGITAENKVYDATTEAAVSTADASFNGMIEGDDLTVSSTGAFADKNAADGKTVNLTNTLGGEDLDNYQITDQGTTTADITAKAITLSGITAENKVYDATTEATVSTADASFNGMIEGDDLTVSSTGAFVDKNAADGKTVNLTNTLGGEDLDNYQITDQGTTTADIAARTLTIDAAGVSRVYDGTTDATVTLSDDRVGGDVLTASYGSASFLDEYVAAGKTVGVSGLAISGVDAANYILSSTTDTTAANITAIVTGAISGIGSGVSVALSLNGGTPVVTTTTDASGSFSFGGNLFVSAGDSMLIYVNNGAYQANLVGTVLAPVNVTDLALMNGQVSAGSAAAVNIASNYSNSDFNSAKGSLTDHVYYSVEENALSVNGADLYVPQNVNFTPGGDVTVAGDLAVAGTYTQDSNLSVTGDFALQSGGVFTGNYTDAFTVGGSFSVPNDDGAFDRYQEVDGVKVIRDLYDLQAMKNHLDSQFKLNASLDASSVATWNAGAGFDPIGNSANPFTGTLDGNGKVISDLEMHRTGTDYLGLFGNISATGSVFQLGLEDVSIYGGNYAGGLAGSNAGSLSSVYTTGSHTVSGVNFVGGLVGDNTGNIVNAYSSARVAGTDKVGGLAGANSGTIDKTYAMGYVTGTANTGGLVGSGAGTVTDSFWDKKMTGQETSSGGTAGKAVLMVADAEGYAIEDPETASDTTSPDMMKSVTYGGWGFHSAANPEGIWVMDEGGTYPHFQFRYPEGVRGVGGYVYLVTTTELVTEDGTPTGIISRTVSPAGPGQNVDLYYSNDGESEISLDYSIGTGPSSRYYGVLGKTSVADTDFVIAKSLNGDSKMLAESGSIFPLDVWDNETHTVVRPAIRDIVVTPLTNQAPKAVDETLASITQTMGGITLPITQPPLGTPPPSVTIEEEGMDSQSLAGMFEENEDALENVTIDFVEEPPPGREPIPVR